MLSIYARLKDVNNEINANVFLKMKVLGDYLFYSIA
jgi:hypothetical protein